MTEMTEHIQNQLSLTDAYRATRNKTSIFCGIGLAWSAAQFELREVSLSGIGKIDLSGASVALLISLCILYSFTRCTTEYAMQPKNIRRWKLACFDFKLSLNLVRGSLLMLAASGLNRSVSTASYVVISVVLFLVVSMFMEVIGVFTLTPLLIFIREKQGRHSVVSRVAEASAWSRIVSLILAIIVLISFGFSNVYYSPVRALWQIPPCSVAIWAVTVTGSLVLTSFVLQHRYLNELFALVEEDKSTNVTTIYNEKGEVTIKYKKIGKSKEKTMVSNPHS